MMMPNLFFVIHPGVEPACGHNKIGHKIVVPPNTGKTHRRKLICRNGKVLGSNNTALAKLLYFWGEYESGSEAVVIGKGPISPKGLHFTLLPATGSFNVARCSCNTDPYVYGDEFYYSCCKRKSRPGTYQNGDIILFGSWKKGGSPPFSFSFELDTLMVVKEERDLKMFSRNSNFYRASILPLARKAPKSIVVGEMYHSKDNPKGPFSFVPCRTSICSSKPEINLSRYGIINSGNPQMNPAPVSVSAKEWSTIVSEVQNQGFELGVFMLDI
ncbi:MAG: hypothetical protein J6L98_01065, partial [Bacteroidales bacterium]|nr:hypothetical protein [Bacteroidales bacterium]